VAFDDELSVLLVVSKLLSTVFVSVFPVVVWVLSFEVFDEKKLEILLPISNNKQNKYLSV